MKSIKVTLPAGGLDASADAVYVLLVNKYVYVGITGTSNRTGRSSPHERLCTHVRKHGKTKSAVWKNVIDAGLLPKENVAVRMVSVFVETGDVATRIEKQVIHALQERLEAGDLLNKPEQKPPSGITSSEADFSKRFIGLILDEQKEWLESKFGQQPGGAEERTYV